MQPEKAILDQWFACAVQAYAAETVGFLDSEKDQFRNPVGYTLRENLATLVRELLGDMDMAAIKSAVEAITRVRAVQDMTARQAVEFVFALRPIVRKAATGRDPLVLDERIDELALTVFDEYMRCRERVAEIRFNESKRSMREIGPRRASGGKL